MRIDYRLVRLESAATQRAAEAYVRVIQALGDDELRAVFLPALDGRHAHRTPAEQQAYSTFLGLGGLLWWKKAVGLPVDMGAEDLCVLSTLQQKRATVVSDRLEAVAGDRLRRLFAGGRGRDIDKGNEQLQRITRVF